MLGIMDTKFLHGNKTKGLQTLTKIQSNTIKMACLEEANVEVEVREEEGEKMSHFLIVEN